MEKVMLTKEQAIALESAIEINSEISNVVQWHVRDLWSNKREALNGVQLDVLIRALYIGYEIEPTPEDKVCEYFQGLFPNNESAAKAVRETLNLLNIQIKGVNC